MRRALPPRRLAAALLTVLTAAAPGGYPQAASPPLPAGSGRSPAALLDGYWTPGRMAAARPVGTGPAEARGDGRRSAVPPSHPFPGIPQVGTFFWVDGSGAGRFCGATVVRSPHRDLAVSAGHCLSHPDPKRYLSFVPQYHDGLKPYGVFPVEQIHIDPRYLSLGPARGARFDYSVVRLGPRADGRQVEDVVGGADLGVRPGFDHPDVRLIGYPGSSDRLHPEPLDCRSATTRFTSTDPGSPGEFLRIACAGYIGGTSGGPFLLTHPYGDTLIGVIGGYHTGGNTPDISYSPYFTADTLDLYLQAVAGDPAADGGPPAAAAAGGGTP